MRVRLHRIGVKDTVVEHHNLVADVKGCLLKGIDDITDDELSLGEVGHRAVHELHQVIDDVADVTPRNHLVDLAREAEERTIELRQGGSLNSRAENLGDGADALVRGTYLHSNLDILAFVRLHNLVFQLLQEHVVLTLVHDHFLSTLSPMTSRTAGEPCPPTIAVTHGRGVSPRSNN